MLVQPQPSARSGFEYEVLEESPTWYICRRLMGSEGPFFLEKSKCLVLVQDNERQVRTLMAELESERRLNESLRKELTELKAPLLGGSAERPEITQYGII